MSVTASHANGIVTLTFPEATPSVNALHGRHWGRKHKERKKWGWYATAAALELSNLREAPPLPFGCALVTVERFGPRLLDEDNCLAGCKWLMDGLVANGVFVDDSPKHLRLRPPLQHVGKDRKTVINIQENANALV